MVSRLASIAHDSRVQYRHPLLPYVVSNPLSGGAIRLAGRIPRTTKMKRNRCSPHQRRYHSMMSKMQSTRSMTNTKKMRTWCLRRHHRGPWKRCAAGLVIRHRLSARIHWDFKGLSGRCRLALRRLLRPAASRSPPYCPRKDVLWVGDLVSRLRRGKGEKDQSQKVLKRLRNGVAETGETMLKLGQTLHIHLASSERQQWHQNPLPCLVIGPYCSICSGALVGCALVQPRKRSAEIM